MKNTSLRWILCTCALVLLPYVSTNESIEFQMNDGRCLESEAKTPGGIRYQCYDDSNDSSIDFETTMTLEKEFKITCSEKNEFHPPSFSTYLNVFKNATLPHHLEQFTLEDCTIPDISLSEILNELNVTTYPKKIQLQSIFNGGDGLTGYHFENLTKIETLRIASRDFITINESVFQSLPLLNELSLNNVSIPSEAFKYTPQLTKLELVSNNWTVLNGEIFQYMPNLTSFTINNQNDLANFSENLFAKLNKLEYLDLKDNHLADIPEKLFVNLGYLSTVLLNNNKLERLPEKLFEKCRSLTELNLENNRFNSFNDTLFHPLKQLRKLKLAGNNLSYISSNAFNGLTSLTELDASHNNLMDLQQNTFSVLSNIVTINLSFNRLTLSRSVFANCPKLETLNLSNNLLTTIFDDWREKLINLRTLDLSFNEITTLKDTNMIFLSAQDGNLVTIYLNDNNISTIAIPRLNFLFEYYCHSLLGDLPCAKSDIILKNNPIKCDCYAAPLAEYLSNTSSNVSKTINLKSDTIFCNWPDSLKDKQLQKVDRKKLLCPLLSCPERCECGYRDIDKSIVLNCSGRSMDNFPLPEELPPHNNYSVELLFDNNNFTSLVGLSPLFSKVKVTNLSMSFNQLENIDILEIPETLKFLALDNNKLSNLNQSFIDQLTSLEIIQLNGNPWRCDCGNQPLWNFLHLDNKLQMVEIANIKEITCNMNESLIIKELSLDDFCPKRNLWFGLFVGFVFLISVIITLYCMYESEIKGYTEYIKWLLWDKRREFAEDKEFDAFLSYCSKDGTEIINEIIRHLEGCTPPYKLCHHLDDFQLSERIEEQIKKFIKRSTRTIIVLTPKFLQSPWAKREFQEADLQTIMDHRCRVIIVLHKDVNTDELEDDLKDYINLHTYVEWGNPLFWEKLKCALSQPPPYLKPEYWIRHHKHYRRRKATRSNPEPQSEEEVPLNEI